MNDGPVSSLKMKISMQRLGSTQMLVLGNEVEEEPGFYMGEWPDIQ